MERQQKERGEDKKEREEDKKEKKEEMLKDDERYSRRLRNFEDVADFRLQRLQFQNSEHMPPSSSVYKPEYEDALRKQLDRLDRLKNKNSEENELFRALLNAELEEHFPTTTAAAEEEEERKNTMIN
jgi:flagellar motor protein MotB